MANNIAVIERLAQIGSKPTFFVNEKRAERLIKKGQVAWAIPSKVLRKTPRFGKSTVLVPLRTYRSFSQLRDVLLVIEAAMSAARRFLFGSFIFAHKQRRYRELMETPEGLELRIANPPEPKPSNVRLNDEGMLQFV